MEEFFSCVVCDYCTYNKSNYTKHLATEKHIEKTRPISNNKILCEFCSKSFLYKKNLQNHILKCDKNPSILNANSVTINNAVPVQPTSETMHVELITELVKSVVSQQGMLTQIILNSQQNPSNMSESHNQATNAHNQTTTNTTQSHNTNNNSNNTTNTTNNVFNLNYFLNELCKDAMNLSDFVNEINVTSSDLENIGRNGFVSGITDIVYRCLETCGIYRRPIHCTDLKREILHIKEDGVWKKDGHGNPTIKETIEKIGDKCFYNVGNWMNNNPKCRTLDTPEYNLWLKIGKNVSVSGEDELRSYNKVIKNIANITDLSEIKK